MNDVMNLNIIKLDTKEEEYASSIRPTVRNDKGVARTKWWKTEIMFRRFSLIRHKIRPRAAMAAQCRALSSDVVIIGAGAIGCSVANFLLEMQPSLGVVVVEKDLNYNIASSVLSVGSIRQQFSEPVNIAISQYGIEFIRSLAQDPETCVQFDEGGYLFLAQETGKRQLEENVALQQSMGANVIHYGGHEETLSTKFPWLQTEDIKQSAFGIKDEGWFDPYTLTRL